MDLKKIEELNKNIDRLGWQLNLVYEELINKGYKNYFAVIIATVSLCVAILK